MTHEERVALADEWWHLETSKWREIVKVKDKFLQGQGRSHISLYSVVADPATYAQLIDDLAYQLLVNRLLGSSNDA